MTEGKRYGLVLPSRTARNKSVISCQSVFGDDDDGDGESLTSSVSVKNDAKKTMLKRQAQLEIEKAVADDPTVYEYDSIYEDLQSKKASRDCRQSSNTDSKPKYIGNLIKAAEDRKKEMERRLERKIHKEREAEKGKYDDKEAFVTTAYREKMELMRREEENERRKEQLEASLDVTKQRDLSGFYRNLLKQAVGENTAVTSSAVASTAINFQAGGHESHEQLINNRGISTVDPSCDRQLTGFQGKKTDRLASNIREKSDARSEYEDINKQEKLVCRSRSQATDNALTGKSREHKSVTVEALDDIQSSSVSELPSSNITFSHKKKREPRDDTCSDRKTEFSTEKNVEVKNKMECDHQQLKFLKRTTDSSLSDARARYLARKASMRVPVLQEDNN